LGCCWFCAYHRPSALSFLPLDPPLLKNAHPAGMMPCLVLLLCCRRQFQAFQQAAHRATSADTDAAALLQPITLPLPQQQQQQQQEQTPHTTPHTTPPASPAQPSPSRRPAAAAVAARAGAAAGSPRRPGGGSELLVSGVTPGGDIASLCEVPFLLTTEAKSKILRVRARGVIVCHCVVWWQGR
jgi:hypothetical protein